MLDVSVLPNITCGRVAGSVTLLGTLTEGTPHRRQALPREGGPMEVGGGMPNRAKAKRHERTGAGEPSHSGEARYPSGGRA